MDLKFATAIDTLSISNLCLVILSIGCKSVKLYNLASQ